MSWFVSSFFCLFISSDKKFLAYFTRDRWICLIFCQILTKNYQQIRKKRTVSKSSDTAFSTRQ
ncbi:hypothetical protein CUS92_03225 [Enterococcus faecium]|nr:hypothetical protein CUS92_03225 [Enterococcus faecium]